MKQQIIQKKKKEEDKDNKEIESEEKNKDEKREDKKEEVKKEIKVEIKEEIKVTEYEENENIFNNNDFEIIQNTDIKEPYITQTSNNKEKDNNEKKYSKREK